MQLSVKVKAKAKKNAINFLSAESAVLYVTAPASKGKANEAVIALLARHYKIAKSKIVLMRGGKSREKIFEIV